MSARPRPAVLGALSAVAAAALLAGCTSSSPSAATPTGVTASGQATSAGPSGAAAPSGTASPGASGTATGGTAKGGANAVAVPSLRPKPNAKGLPCNAQGLVVHLSQASGAVHGYLAKPATSGATVIALKSKASAATGSKAAKFAAGQLTTGLASAGGCATTGALTSVSRQTSTYLTKLSGLLAAGSASARQVSAAEALIADVASQAQRTGLTLVDKVPDASLLARV